MTIPAKCIYGDDRDRAMVDYLYGESDPGERSRFEEHLLQCPPCRADVGSFRGVRQALAGWAPPEPMRALEHVTPAAAGPRLATAPPPVSTRGVATLPGWAKAAAAVLCVGIGVGAANLQVSYSPDGLSVRTGWMTPPAPAVPINPGAATAPEAWRAELTALERSLRADMASVRPAAPPSVPAANDEALLRQVRALIARSEQRQQSELALRMGDLLNDVQTQRRADLSRIERTIGVVQSNTGMEVMRQREMLNSLAVRVSSQR